MTSKKSLFVLALSLFLTAFGTLNAQTQREPKFNVTSPVPEGTMTVMSAEETAKLNLRHISELTAAELDGTGLPNLPNNFAVVLTTANCQATAPPAAPAAFVVPPNTCLTSNPAAWVSFSFGCTRVALFPAQNCAGGAFVFTGIADGTCIQANPPVAFGSIACLNP